MSSPQVDRLQALLSRVQVNREKPRANGAAARAPQAMHSMNEVAPPFGMPPVQDSIDTTPPPPVAVAKPQPIARQEPARQEPARQEPSRTRPAIEAEHIRVPDMKPAAPPARLPPQPERPMPAPARPTAPGATPLEMALEGEVARAADAAAMSAGPVTAPQRGEQLEGGGRVLADPTPPQLNRPIVQAVTKHPPTTANSFGELLKRSLALRPR